MSVYVSGVGVVSSLGKNYAEHKKIFLSWRKGFPKILTKIMALCWNHIQGK